MTETYMLDTDICSYIIRERPVELKKDFLRHAGDTICISVITYAELLYGLEKKSSPKLARDIDHFAALVQVMDWNYAAAARYAIIRHYLTSAGKVIGALDMQIAASAISIGAKLVTNNSKHFGLIPDLCITDHL